MEHPTPDLHGEALALLDRAADLAHGPERYLLIERAMAAYRRSRAAAALPGGGSP